MPLYDARHTSLDGIPSGDPPLPGSEPFPAGWNGTTNANGTTLSPLLWANTETGEVGRYDVRDGKWQTDPVTKRVVVLHETHPAPLRAKRPTPAQLQARETAMQRWPVKRDPKDVAVAMRQAYETMAVLTLTDPPADDADDKDDTDLWSDDADPPHVVGG